ncbi:MAG: hypothetical protein KAS32_13385 [Candidatus Peribacteraceae bacterium]|nr:hypothetical protein [Candidatus Peribacteraceae bacterium]
MGDPRKYAPRGYEVINSAGERVRAFTERGQAIGIDALSAATIEGRVFTGGHLFMAVADTAFADLRIVTGANETTAFALISAGGDAIANLYKGTTYTAPGTSVPIYNNNENSVITPTFTLFHTPTIDVLGAVNSPSALVFGGMKNQAFGGSVSPSPRILEPSTEYLIRVQNIAGAAKNIEVILKVIEAP